VCQGEKEIARLEAEVNDLTDKCDEYNRQVMKLYNVMYTISKSDAVFGDECIQLAKDVLADLSEGQLSRGKL
jgi:uncharacterized protein YlxW (UPF0749 family)